ncbi:MAG: Holliday junction resolvase RuvX [Bacteroidetes bacterium]|nr:Holliday junction resolvase RuvX [Bacteroidota bacterium]
MPEIIGIDFGLKRTGIAISDTNQIIASPLTTVDSSNLMEFLSALIQKHGITEIVLGFPSKLNGGESHITHFVLLLKEALEKNFITAKVFLQDERFTSKIAAQTISKIGTNKQKKDKGLVDQISATVILQDFLNGKKS